MQARGLVDPGVLVLAVLSTAVALAACGFRPPAYRATAKLLAQRFSNSPTEQPTEVASFFETQVALLRTSLILRRAQQRLGKSPLEISEQLINLEVTRAGQSDIIIVSVDSPSPEFAEGFANALVDEYLKFRDEQKAQFTESALLQLTREINRLSQELKKTNEQIVAYAKEHGDTPAAELELKTMRQDRERIERLHNALLQKLLSIDVGSQFNTRTVTLLEPAIVTEKPRGWGFGSGR